MILIGLGANLPGPDGATAHENLLKALEFLRQKDIKVQRVSPFYKSEPVPPSGQPWFVNAVAALETSLSPNQVLKALHRIEEELGRTRRIKNEARVIDLDLLDYNGRVLSQDEAALVLPHPRMHLRHFVLQPLHDLDPGWRHPVFGKTAEELLQELGGEGKALPLKKGNYPLLDRSGKL